MVCRGTCVSKHYFGLGNDSRPFCLYLRTIQIFEIFDINCRSSKNAGLFTSSAHSIEINAHVCFFLLKKPLENSFIDAN